MQHNKVNATDANKIYVNNVCKVIHKFVCNAKTDVLYIMACVKYAQLIANHVPITKLLQIIIIIIII